MLLKNLFCLLCLSLFVLLAHPLTVYPKSLPFINRIEGRVYDPNRLPVENANVELLNEVDSMIARARTTASGRFTFSGMGSGRYRIKVLPLGTNLQEQSQDVEIHNISTTQNDTEYVDIYLRYDKRSQANANATSRDVIFAQEVPAAAKKLFEEGTSDLPKNQEKGLAKLEEALKIFPTYFDALSQLGRTYILQKNYDKGYPYLIKAIDINPRSYSSFYSLGFAFYQMKQYPAALEAARATTLLAADSADAQLLYGTLLRITGNFPEAEKTLVKADTLFKKTNGETHWQLALLYNKLNRNQEAVSELETFLKLVPDAPDKNKIQEMIAKLKNSANKK